MDTAKQTDVDLQAKRQTVNAAKPSKAAEAAAAVAAAALPAVVETPASEPASQPAPVAANRYGVIFRQSDVDIAANHKAGKAATIARCDVIGAFVADGVRLPLVIADFALSLKTDRTMVCYVPATGRFMQHKTIRAVDNTPAALDYANMTDEQLLALRKAPKPVVVNGDAAMAILTDAIMEAYAATNGKPVWGSEYPLAL